MADPKTEVEEISLRHWLRTIFAGSGAVFMFLFFGLYEAQSATMLPQLKRADSSIVVTPNEESWIASIGLIAASISALVSGPFVDMVGRKRGLQTFYFITALGYAVIVCAKEVYQIYLGRILCGLGTGQLACSVVYLAEISTPHQREYFFSITTGTVAIGVTLSTTIGGYLPWHVASFIYSVAAFVMFIVECFIPESPPWLVKTGKEEAATRSLQKLGRTKAQAEQEVAILKSHCEKNQEDIDWRTFLEPTVWKPFVIMATFSFLSVTSGIFDFLFYSVDFIQRLNTNYDPVAIAVLLSVIRTVASSTIVVFFRSKVNRKTALTVSSFGMTVGSLAIVACDYVYRGVHDSEKAFQWLPVVFLAVYMVASVLGMMGLPTVMPGEVFPLKLRGTLSNAVFALAFLLIFGRIKIYLILINALQFDGLLLIFAAVSFITIFFGIFILPETQNKTLYEIQQGFLPKKVQTETKENNTKM